MERWPGQQFIVWVCPYCGLTRSSPTPATWVPNLLCTHPEVGMVCEMVRVWPKEEKQNDEAS